MSATSYLDRILDPVTQALTPALARTIGDLKADAEIQSHIEELREKANHGTLTPDEEAEYKDIVEAIDVLSILQAKARRFLRQHPPIISDGCRNSRLSEDACR